MFTLTTSFAKMKIAVRVFFEQLAVRVWSPGFSRYRFAAQQRS